MDMDMRELHELFTKYPSLVTLEDVLKRAYEVICHTYDQGGKLLLCGNGGSAADCEHITGELLKEYKIKRPIDEETRRALLALGEGDDFVGQLCGALPAIALSGHVGYHTAFCNDNNPDFVYAQHLYALGKPGDTLLAISTSGNSRNVVCAAKVARARRIQVVSLTGRSGGLLEGESAVCIKVPSDMTARVQEYHLPVYHALCGMLESHYFA